MAVHYIEERNFRISISSLNKEHGVLNQIMLDMVFDEQSFDLLFVPMISNSSEQNLENIEAVNKEFYYYIVEKGVKAYEDLLKSEFGNDIQFDFMVLDQKGIIYQLRMQEACMDEQLQDEDLSNIDIKVELWALLDS